MLFGIEIYTFLGCLVFGYFEAHIGRSFKHKLNVKGGQKKMRKGKIIFMCTWHLQHISTIVFSTRIA
jgi:hypothetical protein